MRTFAAFVAVVVASLAVVGARPVSARATSLPSGFGGIAVDDANQHVFVSSPFANTMTVLDFTGTVVRTLTDLPGARSMVVDGSTLYVVLTGAGVVDAYDTTTFERTGRYGAGKLVNPGPLAMAGGKLWTTTGTCGQWDSQLASIDPQTKAVGTYAVPLMLSYCIGLSDGPHDTNQLVAWTDGLSPASTFRIDVVKGAAGSSVERRQEQVSNIRQIAVLPDRKSFVVAAGSPYEIDTYRVADQLQDGPVYSAAPFPNAVVATEARGGLLAAGLDASYDKDIEVFALGDPSRLIFSRDLGGPENTLFPRGLAWSGDGYRLFAVSGDGNTGATRFNVFRLAPVTVSLSVDLAVSVPGQPVTFTAEVTTETGVDPTGTVAFADASGVLATAPLVGGAASVTLVDLSPGIHDVTATYSGNDTFGSDRSEAVRHTVSPLAQPPSLPAAPGGPTAGNRGYWLVSSSGDVYAFGDARDFGDQPTTAVDIEPTPTNGGYWILSRSGRVYAKGDAVRLGDAPVAGGEHAVSLSATPSGRGYWVFTDQGRVYNFGDAPHRGDMAGVPLNGPVLGSVATPSGQGYWMVASDGGIFAFGDAVFAGSMGGRRMNRPVMSMAPDPDGSGYWLISSDGGVFAFDAPFYGSAGGLHLNRPISGMVPARGGYLMVAEDGGIFAYGAVAFQGSLGGNPPAQPIVAVALTKTR